MSSVAMYREWPFPYWGRGEGESHWCSGWNAGAVAHNTRGIQSQPGLQNKILKIKKNEMY